MMGVQIMSLYAKLNKIAEQVKEQRHLINNEGETILVSVQPFIHALGYNTSSLRDVRSEYGADAKSSGGEKVDFAILRDDKPVMFIEAKAANLTLNENHWKQLHHYFNAEDVRFGILTNGIEYRFYTDLKKRNIMDNEPFLVLDILNLDKQSVKELEPFTKKAFDTERILANAKIQRIVHLLQEEMNSPSDGIVKHFGGRIYSGNVNARIIQDLRPLVRAAFNRIKRPLPLHEEQPRNTPLPKSDPAIDEYTTGPQTDSVVEVPVFATYRGTQLSSTLLIVRDKVAHSKIRFNGSDYWVSKGALVAINTVNPELKNQPNGWNFWELRDPTGNQERHIGELRTDKGLLRRVLERFSQ